MVRAAWQERPIDQVKGLALRLTGQPGVITLLGIAGTRSQLLFGRSEDVSFDLKPLFNAALAALGGGKGGGARLLQGAAGAADLLVLEQALQAVEGQLAGGGA